MAANAAVAVLPGESGAEFKFLSGVQVGPGFPNLGLDVGEAIRPVDVQFPALRVGLHQPQERGGVCEEQLALLGNFGGCEMGHGR